MLGNHALKIQDSAQDDTPLARPNKATHLYIASVAAPVETSDEHGPDLGAFEEQYLLGYACFA